MILRLFKSSSIVLLLLGSNAWANDIFITQSGDNFDLDITQKGSNNIVKGAWSYSEFDGNDQQVTIVQEHSNGTNNNVVEYGAVVGKDNSLEVRQGSDNLGGNGVRSDSIEYSGHYAHVGIIGDDNSIRIGQRNPDDSSHSAFVVILNADGVAVEVTQGSSNTKDAEVWVENDNSNISVLQHNSGAHTAYIDTYGSEPSNLQLEQKGSSANSYSLTQGCYTAGGCSATVTQQ